MFRTQQQNAAEVTEDHEETYQFSGATLKIATVDVDMNMDSGVKNNKTIESTGGGGGSAILSGTDGPVSPQPIGYEASSSDPPEFRSDPGQQIEKPKVGSPRHFFSFRAGLFDQAVSDCVDILLRPFNDTKVLGSWLLTEISHWDHERERVFILTTKSLVEVKYDFIALRVLHHTRIRLNQVDTVFKGKLKYPDTSIVPRLEGISNGVVSIISGGLGLFPNARQGNICSNAGLALTKRIDFTKFKPIERSELGVRLCWNKGQPISFLTSWNPFATNIPWKTITDHPLYSYKDPYNSQPPIQESLDKNQQIYSVEKLHEALLEAFSNRRYDNSDVNYDCKFEEETILLQNYVGVGAMIHNKNNFGFFKVRGKFSF